MTLAFTNDGLQTNTLDEVINSIVADYQAIYGSDINLSQDTADGQRVGIEAKIKYDLETALLNLYDSLDADSAEGQALNRIIKFCGITRRASTKSTWDITVTASKDVTLYSGYTIKDDAGQQWTINTAVNLIAGSTLVTFESVDTGAVQGLVTATFEQVTVIPEVTAFSVSASATVGIDEETDEALRARRNDSIKNPSYSMVGSLFAKLLNLPNVTDAYVYENKTDVYDSAYALDAHSIWVVVEGGTIADIVKTIALQKTGGTGEKGSVSGTYNEVMPNGVIVPNPILFDRPTYQNLYIKLDATRTGTTPVDTALIKSNLATKTYRIDEEANAYTLYDYAALSGNGFYLSGLQISLDGITYTNGQLASIHGGKYIIDTGNITVTEIV